MVGMAEDPWACLGSGLGEWVVGGGLVVCLCLMQVEASGQVRDVRLVCLGGAARSSLA